MRQLYEYSNLIGCGYATDDSTAAEEVNSTVGAKPSRVLVRRTETWHDTAKSEFRHRGQTQESSGNFATVDAERIAGQLSDSKQLAVENPVATTFVLGLITLHFQSKMILTLSHVHYTLN